MVTEIHNDIPYYYMDINDWIVKGVTNDAVHLTAYMWAESGMDIGFGRTYCSDVIRNIDWFSDSETRLPLTKW